MTAAQNEMEAKLLDALSKLDEVELVIFSQGAKAMKEGRLSTDGFEDRVIGLLKRYRAGEDVTLGDLSFA
ncbi:hypothetical protein Q4560_05825 [Celeribacter halophilus]|uniref:hypothetical protein n=1 Tax=Celeribacter halophilus TaxID=576117 RepID=UPI0026E123F8|nr:hypothetical protein [Celeribacter halophilus]MDO6722775.1 hypothetical protein [Celeribacter halophilus]